MDETSYNSGISADMQSGGSFARLQLHEDPSLKQISEAIGQALGIETKLGKHCLKLAITNVVKLDQKQKDYGPDAILRHGRQGVLVRMDDKLARLGNLLKQQRDAASTADLLKRTEEELPNFEPRLDSWLDAANYGLIGAALETGLELT